MPDLVKVAARHRDAGLEVLLVSYDLQTPGVDRARIVERVAGFVDGRRWGLPVAIFDAPDLEPLDEYLELPGPIPVTLALDREGRVVDREEDAADAQRFEELARRALGD